MLKVSEPMVGKPVKKWGDIVVGMNLYYVTESRIHEYEVLDKDWPTRSIGVKFTSKNKRSVMWMRIYGINHAITRKELRR